MTGASQMDCAAIVAAFVTYNPDETLLERAVDSISSQVAGVYLIDNGSADADAIAALCSRKGYVFDGFGDNLGIATAYNRVFEMARDHGASWVITCDQDSVMPAGMVSGFLDAAGRLGEPEKIGIVCPNFFNRTTSHREYAFEKPTEINECISSGSMTSIAAWEAVGGFDEAMFIDGVDFDFCKRLRGGEYTILMVPDVCIEHEIGNARLHRIFGHEFLVLNHSAFRKFYIAQNIVYMSGKYHGGRAQPVAYLKVIKQLLLVLLYERGKAEKCASILRGASRGRELLRERAGRRDARK